jgi:hypothetical protein
MSTTRDPFYSPGVKMDFGLILVRINIPKNIHGTGLLIENFSMFPKEEEFLLHPSCKLKLKARDTKAIYYHTNEKFEKLIKKKYEFNYIDTHKTNINVISNSTIPIIDLFTLKIDSYDRVGLFKVFLENCDEHGNFRFLYNDIEYIFSCQWFDSTESYMSIYKNKTKDGFIINQYIDGYPALSIEMGDIMCVGYLNTKYLYSEKYETDDNDIISHFGRIFKYKTSHVYFKYCNFEQFSINYIQDKEYLYTKLFCDTIYQYYKNNINTMPKEYVYEYGYWMLDKIGKNIVENNILCKLPTELKTLKITWKELFIIITEKYFYLYNRMEEWFNNTFDNVFIRAYYTFNIINYLAKNGYDVVEIPTFKHVSSFDRGDLFKLVYNENIRRID